MSTGEFHTRSDDLFVGGGEMGALMRTIDWSKTPLGPVEQWPQSLQTAVSICLLSRFPILIWWGKGYIKIYNDAYRPMLGTEKHPAAMGRGGQEIWAEIWHIIGPMLESVYYEGKSTWSNDQLLPMNRNGFMEECYFTFSYSPIFDETGGVGGIFTAVSETTQRVIGERRLRTLHELSEGANTGKTAEEASQIAATVLDKNPADIPFALIYLLDESQQKAYCVGSAGVQIGTSISPTMIDLSDQNTSLWSFALVLEKGQYVRVEELSAHFDEVPAGMWAEPPHTALVMPLISASQNQVIGYFIGGVSSRLALNQEYQAFFDLVSRHVGTAVSNARAYDEERRRAEALAELDRAKIEFFSNVSHEFRTPLTLMLNPLQDLLTETTDILSSQQHSTLEIAYRNCLRLLKLVNTLLDFSRIQAQRVYASFEPTDLAAMTTNLASVFRSAVEQTGMQLIIDCPTLPEAVYVDREMWEKIVLNLLSNALKFSFEGEIGVSLRGLTNEAALTVRDTGIGISEGDILHIFERFQRVRGARSRTFEGSGIGLALVQELVKFHGGRIEVSSKVNEGTTFTVFIPYGSAHLPADQISSPSPLSSTAISADIYSGEALRWTSDEPSPQENIHTGLPDDVRALFELKAKSASVLVVDDNADMRDYLQRLLEPHYSVQTANDGQIALNLLLERQPDLVITDVMMPNMNGFELLEQIRQRPKTQTLPVIILSARAGDEAVSEGLQAGADDYLVKPFSARELLARTEVLLQLVRLRREVSQQNAMLQERQRIGRDLHDSVNQTLFAVTSLAESSTRIWEHKPEQAIQQMQEVLSLSRGAMAEMRTLLLEMRPEMILRAKLGELLIHLMDVVHSRKVLETQIIIEDEDLALPDEVQVALYRIAQESINNVIKHSDATHLLLELMQKDGVLILRIQDNGCGFDVSQTAVGFGQGTMRERAESIQAELALHSEAGKGTVVTVLWSPKVK